MFGTLGGPELFLIFVVALIVFGPRKLPDIGKSLGRMMSEFRRASNEFKSTIESEVESEKIKEAMRIEPPRVEPVKAKPPAAAASAAAADRTPGDTSAEADEPGTGDAPRPASEPASGSPAPPQDAAPAPETPGEAAPETPGEAVPETVSRQPPPPAEEPR